MSKYFAFINFINSGTLKNGNKCYIIIILLRFRESFGNENAAF